MGSQPLPGSGDIPTQLRGPQHGRDVLEQFQRRRPEAGAPLLAVGQAGMALLLNRRLWAHLAEAFQFWKGLIDMGRATFTWAEVLQGGTVLN